MIFFYFGESIVGEYDLVEYLVFLCDIIYFYLEKL